MDLQCSVCNSPATVDADGVHRTCDHTAAVIANMTAHATGQAQVNGE